MRRRLSPSERFDWLMAKDFPNVFATTARVHGSCGSGEVRMALDAACQRHPTLRSRILTRPYPLISILSSDKVPPLPLRVVDDASDEDWVEVAEDELQRPLPLGRGPLVRFVLLRRDTGFDLVVVTSHVLADGLSFVHLIRDLLEHLADPDRPITVQESPPGWDAIKDQVDKAAPTAQPSAPTKPAGFHQPGPPTGPFTVLNWTWDPGRGAALLDRCRAERTTVHAALSVAMLRGIAQLDEGHPVRRVGSPISTRRYLPERYKRAFGCYVGPSAMVPLDTAANQEFWTAVRGFKAALDNRAEPASFRAASRVLRVLYRLPGPLARPMIRKWINDEYDVWISNLARLPVPVRYGTRRLEAIHLAINTGGARRRILGVTELDGRMDFTLASSHGKLMEQAFDRAMSVLALNVPWPADNRPDKAALTVQRR